MQKSIADRTKQSSNNMDYTDGQLHYEITGLRRFLMSDAYYFLIEAPWQKLLTLAFLGYLVLNLFFASLYWSFGGIGEGEYQSFADAFFFSIQTFSTIGYGTMSPTTFPAHVLVTVESFVGLISVALATGLIFAKFARPSARVSFSEKMVIHNRDGIPTLQFRIANERQNSILNARMNVSVLLDEVTNEGHQMRRFRTLRLERDESPLFALTWTLLHTLDESSPLYEICSEDIQGRMQLIICTFDGLDNTFLQTVQSFKLYRPTDIHFDVSFADMIEHADQGMIVHHERLDVIEPSMEAGNN